jgi:hypothetical protein
MSVSARRVIGLYRDMLQLTRAVARDHAQWKKGVFFRYVKSQFRLRATEKDPQMIKKYYLEGQDLLGWRQSVDHHYVRLASDYFGWQLICTHDLQQ